MSALGQIELNDDGCNSFSYGVKVFRSIGGNLEMRDREMVIGEK